MRARFATTQLSRTGNERRMNSIGSTFADDTAEWRQTLFLQFSLLLWHDRLWIGRNGTKFGSSCVNIRKNTVAPSANVGESLPFRGHSPAKARNALQ